MCQSHVPERGVKVSCGWRQTQRYRAQSDRVRGYCCPAGCLLLGPALRTPPQLLLPLPQQLLLLCLQQGLPSQRRRLHRLHPHLLTLTLLAWPLRRALPPPSS